MNDSISYASILPWAISALCIGYAVKTISETNAQLLSKKNNFPVTLLLGLVLVFYIGFRPISGGDNRNYEIRFERISQLPSLDIGIYADEGGEWLFTYLMKIVSTFGTIHEFFLLIAIIYVGGHILAFRKIIPSNPYAIFLLTISSFSFFPYANNGIRNGVACAIILIALTYLLNNNKKDVILSALLCLIAISIHTSTVLPAAMMFITYYVIKDFRICLAIWGVCIIASLIGGHTIANMMTGLGFDERLDRYIMAGSSKSSMSQFSQSGFRWDFLLYSALPIIIGIYVLLQKKIKSRKYSLLLNTYCLCNAFWILVIYVAFSNRFAYLSWFMYPFVLGYPLLKMEIFDNQAVKFAIILMFNLVLYLVI